MLKKILGIWFLYITFVSLITITLNFFNLTSVKIHSLKEVLFAQWGYGWDGMHYLKIAVEGYHFPLQAFFPLYPMLLRFCDFLLPLTLAYRLNVLLLLGTLVALYFYQKTLGIKPSKGVTNLALFLCFPTAFFLQANYTETLYILLSALILILFPQREDPVDESVSFHPQGKKRPGTLVHGSSLHYKKYLGAGILGILLALTKVSGAAIVLVIFVSNKKTALISAIPLLGIFLYFWYLQTTFGDFMVFFKAQAEWGRLEGNIFSYLEPLVNSVVTGDVSAFRRVTEVLSVVLALILLKKSWRKLPLPVWVYSFLQVFIPLSTGSLLSFNRLILLAFPLLLYFVNGIDTKLKLGLYVGFGVFLQVFLIYLFLGGNFVG